MDYASAVEELFAAPHAQFVAERKRLSGELRTGGKKLEAARLLAIQRPPISAWVVNHLWRDARDAFDEMFATADRLRAGDLSASQAHRESIARLRARAATILEEAGHNAAEGTLRRVGVTLSALAATGGFTPEQPGCLADDRDPPGFEAIAAMGAITSLPSGGLPPGAVLKPIGAPLRKAQDAPIDHEAALRSLDDDADDTVDVEAAAMAEQQQKFAAVQAIVEKQRAAAAAAAANAAAAVANRKAAAAAPPPATEDDEDAADAEADADAGPAAPAPLPVNDKFAAAQAIVARQREMAAKAAATVAAAKAARAAAAAAPADDDTDATDAADDADTDDTVETAAVDALPNKFAAAQAMVAKQREMAAKAAATVAAAKAARGAAAAPAKAAPAEQLAAELATAAVHQAGKAKVVGATERAQRRYDDAQQAPHRPSPPPAESRDDQRKIAERERLRIEVKRARAELHARERAVERLRSQLESAEIAVATAQATSTAYETKLRAIDPSYVPPDEQPPDDDGDD